MQKFENSCRKLWHILNSVRQKCTISIWKYLWRTSKYIYKMNNEGIMFWKSLDKIHFTTFQIWASHAKIKLHWKYGPEMPVSEVYREKVNLTKHRIAGPMRFRQTYLKLCETTLSDYSLSDCQTDIIPNICLVSIFINY